jgi:hypothetical protein
MIRLKNILFEATRGVVSKTNNVKIPLIFGYTYNLVVLQNGRDITKYIDMPPDTQGMSDISITFINNIPITLDLDIFEVKFTPIDGDNLDSKKQRELKKIYNEQGFKMVRGESFPILSPVTIPSFRIGEKRYKDYRTTVYKGTESYPSGNEYPYEKRYGDFEIYNGDQFNVYVTETKSGKSSVSLTASKEGRNKKTIQKLNKEGWKLSAVRLDDIINNEELQYVEKAGMNNYGFAGVFVGKSKDDIQYFIYVPGLQGMKGFQDVAQKSSFFKQFAKDAQGVYEGGNYFKFNYKDPTNYN